MRKVLFLIGLLSVFFFTACRFGSALAKGALPSAAVPEVGYAGTGASGSGGRLEMRISSRLAQQPTAVPQDTRTPRGRPTRTPRPTPTPPTIPPPSDPESASLMIGFGTLVVIVVVAGVWLNRKNTG
jgi:hypothetical protein